MNTKLLGVGIVACSVLLGCGSEQSNVDPDGPAADATGGETARGGAPTAGAATTSGGAPATAGMQAIGGLSAAGGAPATGGAGAGVGPVGGNSAIAGAAGHSGSNGTGGVAGTTSGGGGGLAGAAGHAAGAGGFGGSDRVDAGGHAGVGVGGQHAAGSGGTAGLGPEAPGGRVSGYGLVMFQTNLRTQIVRLETTMLVPPKPSPSGTLFLWPGLQPDGANFEPIDNGVLQPVLTWGPSCAPGDQPREYSTWWISGQYVNTNGNEPGYIGCNGGTIMSVEVGDTLTIDMELTGTVWTQTISDEQSGESVSYSIDMLAQAQNIAYFVIEEYSSTPVSEVIFTDTVITFDRADASDCELTARGKTDYVSVPVPSSDGRTCSISDIILRAEGID